MHDHYIFILFNKYGLIPPLERCFVRRPTNPQELLDFMVPFLLMFGLVVTFFPSLLSVFCQLTISDSWERQHGQHKMEWICVTHKTPFFIFVQTTILVLQLNQVIRVGVIQRGWSRRIFVFVPNNLQKNR